MKKGRQTEKQIGTNRLFKKVSDARRVRNRRAEAYF
jgi:hypothetical protein